MQLIGRYVFRQAALAFIVSFLTLTAIIWLTQVLRQLDVLTIQGQSVWIFLSMTLLALPAFVSVIAPIALFLASMYTLNRLNADSELVVISAAGASRARIIAPFLVLAAVVAILVGSINLYLMPKSLALWRELITTVRENLITQIIQPGRFTSPDANFTIHIRERTANGELRGLLLRDAREPDTELVYLADTGRLVSNKEGTYLLMQNGTVQRNEGEPGKIQIVAYDRYVVDLSQLKPPSGPTLYKPRERDTAYLLNPDPDDVMFQGAPGKYRAELHERLSSPLFPFAFVLVALAFIGFARTNRDGRGLGIVLAIVVALALRLAGFATTGLTAKSAAAVPLVYAAPVGVIVLCGLIAYGIVRPVWLQRGLERLQDLVDRSGLRRLGSSWRSA